MKILLVYVYLVKDISYMAQKADMDQVAVMNRRIALKEKGEKRK